MVEIKGWERIRIPRRFVGGSLILQNWAAQFTIFKNRPIGCPRNGRTGLILTTEILSDQRVPSNQYPLDSDECLVRALYHCVGENESVCVNCIHHK